jgi:hypothetical protein
MSEKDHIESPIEAQMVAPAATYRQNSASGTSAGDRKREKLFDRPWFITVLILHLGAFGIPAYWRTRYSVRTRVMLVVVSIIYTVIAVAIIAWGLMQIWKLF